MKYLIYIFCIISISFAACKNKTNESKTADDVIQEAHETTAVIAKEGRGKISLQYGGKTMEINGVCGAITTMGSVKVAVRDDSVPAKIFTVSFATEKLPDVTTTYTILGSTYDVKGTNAVSIGFADFSDAVKASWDSDKETGKLDFVVNGNEIKCTFSNLPLQPNTLINNDAFEVPATVSGELTIYKD